MCHYLLPEKESDEDPWVLNGRYAEDAFLLLGEQFAALGIALGELEAKLFGGGRMLPKSTKTSSTVRLGVGQKNIDRGIELLQHYDVNLVASHHGSIGHRQIEFDLASGEVEVYFSETKMTVTV